MNCSQLLEYIIRPTLKRFGYWSESAEQLLLATAAHESHCGEYVHELNGPALGIYQCEPATHEDIWNNYLVYNPALTLLARSFVTTTINGRANDDELIWNMAYATVVCRIHYLRIREPLPAPGDIRSMADYWGRHYQTENDPEKKRDFLNDWDQYVIENGH